MYVFCQEDPKACHAWSGAASLSRLHPWEVDTRHRLPAPSSLGQQAGSQASPFVHKRQSSTEPGAAEAPIGQLALNLKERTSSAGNSLANKGQVLLVGKDLGVGMKGQTGRAAWAH